MAYHKPQQQQQVHNNNPPTPVPFPNIIPIEVLRDLICRFITNIPIEERENNIRICFQIELAHWLFIDHYCKPQDSLHNLAQIPFNVFASLIFQTTPFLRHHTHQEFEQIIGDFKTYKAKVPTYGAILMDYTMSQVLLVQGFGNTWGFPKGKVNKDEEAVVCAIREVKEETGFDITSLLNPNHFIESNANERNARLYLIVGVDPTFPFRPQTNYEIRQIGWFDIGELPENKRDTTNVSSRGYNNNQFYTTFSFIRRLKKWIADKKSGTNQINCFRCPTSSMRFPYANDNKTVWETDSPVTPSVVGQSTSAAAAVGGSGPARPVPISSSTEQRPGVAKNKPHVHKPQPASDDLKWAQKFQLQQAKNPIPPPHGRTVVQIEQEEAQAAAAAQGKARRGGGSGSGEPNHERGRQVKRRLQFNNEDSTTTTTAATTKGRGGSRHTSRGSMSPKLEPNPQFFDGPGASAWLNFTLSLSDFKF